MLTATRTRTHKPRRRSRRTWTTDAAGRVKTVRPARRDCADCRSRRDGRCFKHGGFQSDVPAVVKAAKPELTGYSVNRETGEVTLPRTLKPGRFYIGPDFYGCCNTGTAPAILKSRHVARFFVGPELAIESAVYAVLADKAKQVFVSGRDKVFIFKTAANAKAKFAELVKAACERNRQIAADHRRDRDLAAKGDMAAALRLGDY